MYVGSIPACASSISSPASRYPSLRPVNRLIAKVTPFSFDDDPMYNNQTSRRASSTLLALSAATLMTFAPLAAEADSDRHHHRHPAMNR